MSDRIDGENGLTIDLIRKAMTRLREQNVAGPFSVLLEGDAAKELLGSIAEPASIVDWSCSAMTMSFDPSTAPSPPPWILDMSRDARWCVSFQLDGEQLDVFVK